VKKVFLFIFISLTVLACKKNKIEVEEKILFETNAASTNINSGSTFDLKITIKSKIPSNGLSIEVNASEENGGASIIQPGPISLVVSSANFMVQNLPRQKWVVVNVKVKSIRDPLNFAEQSFRIIYK
jgi:hypothetical protein